ncbi:MAG: DUF1553 domain-containing protein, partial [bacterium]
EQQKTLDEAIAAESAALKALDNAAPQSEKTGSKPETITQVLFDDVFAYGAETRNTTRNASNWLNKPEFGTMSGNRVLQLSNGQFSEENITPTITPVVLGDSPRFSVWVRLDPLNTPRTISVELNNKRVVWGDGSVFTGTAYAQEGDVAVGPLPKRGEWTQLSFDPAVLGFKSGTRISVVSVQQFGGTAVFDRGEFSGQTAPDKHAQTSFATWWKQAAAGKKNPPELPAALAKTLATAPEKVTDAKQREALQRFYLARIAQPVNDDLAKRRFAWENARAAHSAADLAIPGTFIFRDAETPRDTFIAMRGAYNKLGDKVEPTTPAAFHPLKKSGPRATRLDLAQWLVAPENPMTARVTVNRFWQQVFGIGLVKTSHDFGSQGEPPSHPELLDDLAVRFQKGGWNVKELIKELVMTKAVRQSSRMGALQAPSAVENRRSLDSDPDNRLLARGPRIRLDAEQIRDNALFVSGLINLDMGGRGVRTYQPPNIWEPVGYGDSNTRYDLQDHGPSLYRRSLYSFLKRTAPPPFMSNFDAPNREQSCTRRERSNTPMQALQLMNDVQHFEAARALAERVIAESGQDDEKRLHWLFRTVLSRKPDAKEFSMLTAALAKQRELYQKDPKAAEKAISVGESTPKKIAAPAETAAWTLIANLVLNLDETVTRN